MSWTVEPMRPEELAVCAAIERHAPDPWTEAQLAEELSFEGARLFVVRRGDAIAGLAAFQLAADEASLNTVTIHPSFRRPFHPHRLVLMSRPEPLTDDEAHRFADFIREHVLRYSEHEHPELPRIG